MVYEEFSKYGEIVDYIVMKNPETGASRGFGFVTYSDTMGAESALRAGPFKIDGRTIEAKLCQPKYGADRGGGGGGGGGMQKSLMNNMMMGGGGAGGMKRNENCKVFVGGLPNGVGEEDIKQFFSRYGPVSEI